MRKYSFTDKNGKTWERIDKKTARTAYNNGLTVLFCPVNLRPGKPWNPEAVICPHSFEVVNDVITPFEKRVNEFEYYNCINNETGRYTAFYIPVREVDRFTGEAPTPETLGKTKRYDYKYLEEVEL